MPHIQPSELPQVIMRRIEEKLIDDLNFYEAACHNLSSIDYVEKFGNSYREYQRDFSQLEPMIRTLEKYQDMHWERKSA